MKALAALLLISVVVVAFPERTTAFTVVNSGATAYQIDGVNNPTLALTRGQTYVFNVTAIGHPFFVKTVRTTGTGNQYTSGVTGQGVTSGSLTFIVPLDAPNQLFYQCGVHSSMGGTLNISGPVGVAQGGVPAAVWLGPASPNPAHDGAQFSFGLPRQASISLVILDARGRRVKELRRGTMPAGQHSVAWSGLDEAGHLAPSGLYFFLLRVEGRVLSGRLVMAR